jgi:UDP:flavonoid glycosyltransferase YjiC (YdhE family)
VVFSDWSAGQPDNLPANVRTAPISRDGFLAQLAKGSALITTAGNQVIGEAVYLHKPVLAFPEPDVLEQELNALALQRSGYGESFQLGAFTPERWDAFEARMAGLAAGMEGAFRNRRAFDGRRQALRTLHRFIRNIASEAGPRRKPRVSFAR